MSIPTRLQHIRDEIASACARAGRDPSAVTLVAVSKRKPVSDIRTALRAGQRDFGENYAQELRDKHREMAAGQGGDGGAAQPAPATAQPAPAAAQPASAAVQPASAAAQPAPASPRWHFIGPLQRNKVKYVVGTAALIHTVDSERLLEAIDARAERLGVTQEVLVQVNLAAEPQKSGVSRDDVQPLLDAFAKAKATQCRGLMLMPPYDPDPEASRPLFAELRALRDALAATPRAHVSLQHLSMGMSHDFRVAIEEGATLVRVGTAIFGERMP